MQGWYIFSMVLLLLASPFSSLILALVALVILYLCTRIWKTANPFMRLLRIACSTLCVLILMAITADQVYVVLFTVAGYGIVTEIMVSFVLYLVILALGVYAILKKPKAA